MSAIGNHIASFLGSPDLVFLQEIQDDTGETDNGVVTANVTLGNLVAAVNKVDNTTLYNFTNIPGIDNEDGGVPGGNIRPAYLYALPRKVLRRTL